MASLISALFPPLWKKCQSLNFLHFVQTDVLMLPSPKQDWIPELYSSIFTIFVIIFLNFRLYIFSPNNLYSFVTLFKYFIHDATCWVIKTIISICLSFVIPMKWKMEGFKSRQLANRISVSGKLEQIPTAPICITWHNVKQMGWPVYLNQICKGNYHSYLILILINGLKIFLKQENNISNISKIILRITFFFEKKNFPMQHILIYQN